ncbi:hypothetical protein [Streptomyces sp. NPDC021356]|uniref:hypothetical protein n=1 Tax=Streptomyces sp. NPDC021356 TaxID=3154900 RepID=UPI0033F932FE
MADGRIEEIGTHGELLPHGGDHTVPDSGQAARREACGNRVSALVAPASAAYGRI